MRFIAALLIGWLSAGAVAQSSVTDGVLINADSMFRDLEKRTVRLEGNVQLVFQGQHLSCDRATIDLKNQRLKAEGRVILVNESVHVEGDRIEFSYKQNVGYIYNGFVQSGQVVFEGDLIEKIDKNRYLATNGKYTACETCPPGWSFSGRKIDAEIGGYARIKRPVFRVGGVPILILPSLIVPLKSARQSGFLVPSADYSRKGGVALSESYFWAISRSQDLTLTGKWYDKRGLKGNADYRFVLSDNSRGRMNSMWTEDRAFQRLMRDYNFDGYLDRWYIDYGHYFEMPDRFVQRTNLILLSDLRLPRDFPEEVAGHGDPALENKVSITKTTDDHYFSGEVDIYTNLLKTYPLAENEDAVHRAPEIRYSLKDQELWERGPLFSLDGDFTNFARDKYNYDDVSVNPIGPKGEVTRDGVFNPATDFFRTGQRIDVTPRTSYPFHLGRYFEINPGVLYRETQYRFYPTDAAETSGFTSTASRRYLQTDLSVKTEWTSVFGDFADPKGSRWKHSIEPELGYSQIAWARRPDHPFFGSFKGQQYSRQYEKITDADVNNPNTKLQFDYEDRTYEKRVTDFILTNRFTRKKWLNGEPDYKTVALLRLSQSYDFKESQSPTPHAWSPINALLDARFEKFETYTTAAYSGYAKVTDISSRIKVMPTPRNFFQVAYTRSFDVSKDDYTVAGETRNVSFGAGFGVKYLEAQGNVDFEARTFKMQSWSYLLNIRPPGHCWNIKFEHAQVVGSDDPRFKASFAFDFGGNATSKAF